jgi:hypothetical protein
VRPLTIMSTQAAIASAKLLSSHLMSASGVTAVFSSSPENAASASSAVAAIETAKAGKCITLCTSLTLGLTF